MRDELTKSIAELNAQLKALGGSPASVNLSRRNLESPVGTALITAGYAEIGEKELTAEIEIVHGLLSVAGHQITLYINQPRGHGEPWKGGKDAPRFHLVDCRTLQEMRDAERYDRYVVHSAPNLKFPLDCTVVEGEGQFNKEVFVDLWACKNCMAKLGLPTTDSYVRNFDRVAFFKEHESKFRKMPKYKRGEQGANAYPDNWPEIRERIKEKNNWCCNCCGVNLSEQKYRWKLDAHHRNGNLWDVDDNNLEALCKSCHSRQKYHSSMRAKETDNCIRKLREQQGLPRTCPKCRS